jgi:hypothetical protein
MAVSDDRRIFSLRLDRAYRRIYEGKVPALCLDGRLAFHDTVIDRIGADTALLYLEFGVARGASIIRFASKFKNPQARLVGFDSFVGLPEAWARYDVGHFSTEGRFPAIDDERVEFVAGWFQNSVPKFFTRNLGLHSRSTILVHYDADLYSSTLFLLSALWWHIPEYYFIMDEFYGDELIALHDFHESYPIDIEYISEMEGGYSKHLGRATPHKIFGRIRNVEMMVE